LNRHGGRRRVGGFWFERAGGGGGRGEGKKGDVFFVSLATGPSLKTRKKFTKVVDHGSKGKKKRKKEERAQKES